MSINLPSPGISENTPVPTVPDLHEEKLRSQLEEEKIRCPLFLLAHPAPAQSLHGGQGLPWAGREALPAQARSFSRKWVNCWVLKQLERCCL